MDALTLTLAIACAAVHVLIGLLCIRNITRNVCGSLDFVTLAHCTLVLFPMAFDAVFSRPSFGILPLFAVAVNDTDTYRIYLAYMTAVTALFYLSTRRFEWLNRGEDLEGAIKRMHWLLVAGVLSVAFYLPLCPDLGSFFTYGYLQQSITTQSAEVQTAYRRLYSLTYLPIGCGAALLLQRKRSTALTCLISSMVILSVYVNGKRNIVFVALLFFFLAYRMNGVLAGRRLVLTALAGLVMYVGFHLSYAEALRPFLGSTSARLEASRIDFGHDLDICTALLLETQPQLSSTLEYRGETLLFNAMQFVPRSWWPDKPYPYYHYLTGRVLSQKPGLSNWGLTSSWFGECVANAGWFGLLLAPATFLFICRTGDRCAGLFPRLMTVIVGTLFLGLDPSSFVVFIVIWCVLVLTSSRTRAEQLVLVEESDEEYRDEEDPTLCMS